jgi:dihydroorotate dehydrogenase (NAD+) catalytic subunit
MLHTGHPNPGLRQILQTHARKWALFSIPVIVHVLGGNTEEVKDMMEILEDVEPVSAIELSLEGLDPESTRSSVSAAAISELPLIVNLSLDQDLALAMSAEAGGAAAISLGPPRGLVQTAAKELISGRIFGPHLFPSALRRIQQLAEVLEIPIIGSGGVYGRVQAESMLEVGARAVQLDAVLWVEPDLVTTLAEGRTPQQ